MCSKADYVGGVPRKMCQIFLPMQNSIFPCWHWIYCFDLFEAMGLFSMVMQYIHNLGSTHIYSARWPYPHPHLHSKCSQNVYLQNLGIRLDSLNIILYCPTKAQTSTQLNFCRIRLVMLEQRAQPYWLMCNERGPRWSSGSVLEWRSRRCGFESGPSQYLKGCSYHIASFPTEVPGLIRLTCCA